MIATGSTCTTKPVSSSSVLFGFTGTCTAPTSMSANQLSK
jgi:hypothetical protein